ncbi:hypothetical protein HWV62_15627 [Athelia sp. TMB]|nr:hypothetical protein HWV62_15627 [Athelia sp. TMB]
MDRVPFEIWIKIFSFACTDAGFTGRSLSLVSKFVRDASAQVKLQKIADCVEILYLDVALNYRVGPVRFFPLETAHLLNSTLLQFNIPGTLIVGDLPFRIKKHTASNNVWKYISQRVAPKGTMHQFVGTWGLPQEIKAGECVFSVLDQSSCVSPPAPIEGQWTGHYAYNGSAQGHPMMLAMSLDPGVPFTPNGPFHIVGTGTDDAGAFNIKGTVGEAGVDGLGGQVDFVKSYSSWGWKYQGRHDGRGAIEGTWGDEADMATDGSFQLTQEANLTFELAASIV